MTWECRLPDANVSSSYHEMAVATASGTPTLELSADDQDSGLDQAEFITNGRSSAKLDRPEIYSGAYQTMLASEHVLLKDWDDPGEEAAWAYL